MSDDVTEWPLPSGVLNVEIPDGGSLMPAEIDSMMYVREVPWHGQGTRLENPATAEEAIQASGLDWEVQKQPLYTGVDRNIRIKDRYAICRTDHLEERDGGQLAVVGRDYTPLQNWEAFSFLDPVVGKGGAVYHTAGSLRSGRRIWMLAKLPGYIRVVGDDIAEKYILLSNGHDGTAAVRIGLTPIRVVCMNTLNVALQGMSGLSIRHNPDVGVRVKDAHRLIGLINNSMNRAGACMQAMAATPIVGDRMSAYFEQVMPLTLGDERGRERVEQKRKKLAELFETGDGNQMPGVRGTLWAAYNAVTQYVDRESYTKRNKEPLNTIWFGAGERMKREAFGVAAEMAGVA